MDQSTLFKDVLELPWARRRRLELIEARLFWERAVNRGEITDYFGISQQQASADLALYAQIAPANLAYDRSAKRYEPSTNFKPLFAAADSRSYLEQLGAKLSGALPEQAWMLGWEPPADMVRVPSRGVGTAQLVQLLGAIREKQDIEITYQSLRRPAPSTRWVMPHALAFDGMRWHTRAWCCESNQFRDFVLSRIQVAGSLRPGSASTADDAWWHTSVQIVVRASQGLTEAQRRSIEVDFGMADGTLEITTRKALAFYVIRQLRLDLPANAIAAQPLELVNREELDDVINAGVKLPDVHLSI